MLNHLSRYLDIARLLAKHGRSDLAKALTAKHSDITIDTKASKAGAEELCHDLEKLGPTFVKLGQFLSTQTHLLPAEYSQQLDKLQDQVPPVPFSQIVSIIQEDLGKDAAEILETIEAAPLAAASLAQVHRAVLPTGRKVVVKVQRPGVREIIIRDMEVFLEVASIIDNHTRAGATFNFQKNVRQLKKELLRELNYKQEAQNLHHMRESLKGFSRIIVPAPIMRYTQQRVLTMDYIEGKKIGLLSSEERAVADGMALADQLFSAYLRQILIDGLVHADPHPGNVLFTPAGKLALIDLGMVVEVPYETRDDLLKLVLAIADGRGYDAARTAIELAAETEDFNRESFEQSIAQLVAEHQNAPLSDLAPGRIVLQIARAANDAGLELPIHFTVLGKTLTKLDRVGRELAPEFDPQLAIRKHAQGLLQERTKKSVTFHGVYHSFLETQRLLSHLPQNINRILERVANNEFRVHVDAIDESSLIKGLQKIANRITSGLVISSLIIGAALLMQVETSFKLFGYPGLAIIFFIIASALGIQLVISSLYSDQK